MRVERDNGGRCPRTRIDRTFEGFYSQWFDPVVRLCRRLLEGNGDAEAVAQEAFLRAWLSWGRYADERPFGPWIVTIARRLCLNEVQATARRQRVAGDAAQPGSRPDDGFDGVLGGHVVGVVFSRLSSGHRRLLVLRDLEGWSYEEIARIDDATVESVRGRLKRARAAFRELCLELDLRSVA